MSSPRILIIDYGLGNLFSVLKAFEHQGIPAYISDDPTVLEKSDAAILPGVGAFQDGMAGLRRRGLDSSIKEFVSRGKPLLGICLGMQMLMEESSEMGSYPGLGLLRGAVRSFPREKIQNVKIPHMGWNIVTPLKDRENKLLPTGVQTPMFYFVHSYCIEPADSEDILSETEYGGHTFCSMVGKANIYGCQFHPEKSGVNGLAMLGQFSQLVSEAL